MSLLWTQAMNKSLDVSHSYMLPLNVDIFILDSFISGYLLEELSVLILDLFLHDFKSLIKIM